METTITNAFFTKSYSWTELNNDTHWFMQTPLIWGTSAIGGTFGITNWVASGRISIEAYVDLIQEGVYSALIKEKWSDYDAMYASLFEAYGQLLYAASGSMGAEEALIKALQWAVSNGLSDHAFEFFSDRDYITAGKKLESLLKGESEVGDTLQLSFEQAAYGGNTLQYVA